MKINLLNIQHFQAKKNLDLENLDLSDWTYEELWCFYQWLKEKSPVLAQLPEFRLTSPGQAKSTTRMVGNEKLIELYEQRVFKELCKYI